MSNNFLIESMEISTKTIEIFEDKVEDLIIKTVLPLYLNIFGR